MKLVGQITRSELEAEGGPLRIPFPPFDIVVALVDGQPCAIEDACNHAGASLAEGSVEGSLIQCPMHGYCFDLHTGELVTPKGLCGPQRRFVTTVEGDAVFIWDPFSLDLKT